MIRDKITEYLLAHRGEMLARLGELCKIPSVEGTPVAGKPFGEQVDRALRAAEALFAEEGFSVERDPEGRFVLASYGEGERTVGIFTHADVVPEGNGWSVTEPFTPVEHEGLFVARGASDNKGGVIAALYLLKAVRELALPVGARLMVFVGGNEETGMHDVRAFLNTHKAPDVSLVPDNAFPISLGEKGRATGYIASPPLLCDVQDFYGGTAYNVVLDDAHVVLAYSEKLWESLSKLAEGREDVTLSMAPAGDRIFLRAHGRAAHAASPAGSLNAAAVAAQFLAQSEVLGPDERGILASAALFLSDPFGSVLGIAGEDGAFGRRTAVTGMVRVRDGQLLLSQDIRYGAPTTWAELAPLIDEAVEWEEWEAHLTSEGDGYDIGDSDALAADLFKAFCRVTGESGVKPYRSGGGTYARHLPRAYSHGLLVRGVGPDRAAILGAGHGSAHGPDEAISIDGYLAGVRVLIEYAQTAADFLKNV